MFIVARGPCDLREQGPLLPQTALCPYSKVWLLVCRAVQGNRDWLNDAVNSSCGMY